MNKYVSLLLLFAVVFSSCSTYYVSTLDSVDIKKDAETGVFIFENDSVMVSYNFFGEHAPVSIAVYNKLEEPLYIDWQRSALIVDGQAVSYMGDEVAISGVTRNVETSYRTFNNWRTSRGIGTIDATAKLPKGLSFIPPHATIEKTQLQISPSFHQDVADSAYTKADLAKFDGTLARINHKNYTDASTPLAFKSYLTLYVLDEATEKPRTMTFAEDFFVSELIKTTVNPDNLLNYRNKRGDTFFVKKTKGKGLAVAGAVVAAAGVAAAAEQIDNHNNKTAN
ncbi:hypothetical protein H8S90_25355 [Olivibacter sp. SDN3]|uniref:hypothetical protein n=1 Tax=Olivibacter sp. SDN3 TaxID=2764720 RepID=UPI001650F1C1|nr:hypothetical protein [Olivibacter sp. SDN3]QNL49972.1 hypothetical protein H8S90_25355 [Olivibacter sp. SDN3]